MPVHPPKIRRKHQNYVQPNLHMDIITLASDPPSCSLRVKTILANLSPATQNRNLHSTTTRSTIRIFIRSNITCDELLVLSFGFNVFILIPNNSVQSQNCLVQFFETNGFVDLRSI